MAEVNEQYMENTEDVDNASAFDTDFNVDADYKPTLLVPQSTYNGNVKGVILDYKKGAIVWTVVLAGNDETMCTDGETPVNGMEMQYKNWLPRANDKNIRNKKNISKFQSKVNMMKQFSVAMKINFNTFSDISEAIENAEWIGLAVVCAISIDEYNGQAYNSIDRMAASDVE